MNYIGSLTYSLCQKKRTFNSDFLLWPPWWGGPKIHMVDYVNAQFTKSTMWIFCPSPSQEGHKKFGIPPVQVTFRGLELYFWSGWGHFPACPDWKWTFTRKWTLIWMRGIKCAFLLTQTVMAKIFLLNCPITLYHWFQSLFRCRIATLNFSMGFNIISPYMDCVTNK